MNGIIRIRIAGLYVENNKILLVKHHKFGKDYFLLPGGGLEYGETAAQALAREFHEELSVEIKSSNLLFSGESVPPNTLDRNQVLQLVYQVDSLKGDIQLVPDDALVDYYWADPGEIDHLTIYPHCKDQIKDVLRGNSPSSFISYPWDE